MRNKLPVITALLAGAVIALAAVLVLGGGDDDDGDANRTAGAKVESVEGPDGAFTFKKPEAWRDVEPNKQELGAGVPLVAVRRSSNDAFLVIQEAKGQLAEKPSKIAEDLTKRLEKDVPDFQFVDSDEVTLPAGKALSYTFVRQRSGQVQNLVVLPKGDTTYTLNSVVGAKAQKAADEVAQMVRSFEPKESQ